MDREGVGGFLESILAVMAVITASSVFLVVLTSGGLQVENEIDQGDLISWLDENGLYTEDGALVLIGQGGVFLPSGLPESISGMSILYRCSGNSTPLLVLEQGGPPRGDVLAFQLPLLIKMEGWNVPGIMEVRAWH
jgi:hypothetical protein